MSIKQIVPGAYAISLGPVNAFLLDDAGLTLIDTGSPGNAEKIHQAVEELGKKVTDIQQILVTHCHPDHSGSLAQLKQATGAPTYMHPLDAAMVRDGKALRPLTPAPGFVTKILFWFFVRPASPIIEPATVEYEVQDGDELPIAGGMKVIHIPGHCAGQVAFLWSKGGLLFAADAAGNVMGLSLSLGYENLEEGKRSLAKLAALEFETACFGHGKPILQGASAKFKEKWGGL